MAHLDLFISHSPTDEVYSTGLARTLRTAGVWVSHDLSALQDGHLPQTTEATLRHCPVFLVILSPAALAMPEVREICAWAAFQARRDPTRLLLSVMAAPINDEGEWPFADDFTPVEGGRREALPQAEATQVLLQLLGLGPNGFPAAPPPSSFDTVEQVLWAGRILLAQKRYREAALLFEQAVTRAPERFDTWLCKAVVHENLIEGGQAVEEAERALALQPQSALAHACRAGGLWLLKRPQEALIAADTALALDPGSVEAWGNKGVALRGLQRPEEALAAIQQALALDPQEAVTWNNQSTVLIDLARFTDAVAACDQALALDIAHPAIAWNNKGNALGHLQRYQEALAAYDHALELDPQYAPPWNGKGLVLLALDHPLMLNRRREALAHFDRALALDPTSATAWNNKGYVLYLLRRKREALAAFEQALSIDATRASVWNGKGNVLCSEKRFAEALDAYERAIALGPQPGVLKPEGAVEWEGKATALAGLKHYAEALEAYDRFLSTTLPTHARLQQKARLLRKLGRAAEAKAIEKQAKHL